MLGYPSACIPVVALSLHRDLLPEQHLDIGRALRPLRDEGVLIIGSGHSFHNMSGFSFGGNRDGVGAKGLDWDKALNEVATGDAKDRDRKLSNWRDLPGAREAHPREEHLMPLLVVAGAAGEDRGRNILNDAYMGVKASAFCFGGK